MIQLMKFIQTVTTEVKYQSMQQSQYPVEILIPTPKVFQIGIVYWVVVVTT